MKYLPLDSLNDSFIGTELRIDFKSNRNTKTKSTDRNVRKIFARRDTVTLEVAGRSLRFVENWKIYVDHGTLFDQTLQSIDGSDSEKLVIREMFVRTIDESSITFEIYTYRPSDRERLGVQEININKALISGIIVEL